MDSRAVFVCLVSVLGGLVAFLLLDGVVSYRRSRGHRRRAVGIHRGVVAATGTALAAVPFTPSPTISVPATMTVSPAVAAGVLCHVLAVRREQSRLRDGSVPVALSPVDADTLSVLVRTAGEPSSWPSRAGFDGTRLPAVVRELIDAVETVHAPVQPTVPPDWCVLVRLVGEPLVENTFGERAAFGKRKALELLSWMVLNRDRSTRSAARNALWEGTVTDSTFSTILSDMRRALSRIAPLADGMTWSPLTYTDTLPLAHGITTDVDLLAAASRTGDRQHLREALRLVRDMPFAGTTWLWPDLDGSTTRAVIAVSTAVDRLLELAESDTDISDMELAVRAGLRVQPGDDHLLHLERELMGRVRPESRRLGQYRRSVS